MSSPVLSACRICFHSILMNLFSLWIWFDFPLVPIAVHSISLEQCCCLLLLPVVSKKFLDHWVFKFAFCCLSWKRDLIESLSPEPLMYCLRCICFLLSLKPIILTYKPTKYHYRINEFYWYTFLAYVLQRFCRCPFNCKSQHFAIYIFYIL